MTSELRRLGTNRSSSDGASGRRGETILLVAGAASFSTRDVWEGFIEGFHALELEVIPYPTFSLLSLLSVDTIASDVIGKALDPRNAVRAVVFIDGFLFRGERSWVPAALSRAGVPTVLIATDDPYKPIAPDDDTYTLRFTNERACATARVPYLPVATKWIKSMRSRHSKATDVVFVGTVFEDRWPIIRSLAQHCEERGIQFDVLGHFLVDVSEFATAKHCRFIPGTVDELERHSIYGASRVVLNVFRESSEPCESANPRVYEVGILGGPILLSGPRRREVDELFGDMIFQFTDAADLTSGLDAALAAAGKPSRAREFRERVAARHLYEHRAASLVAALTSLDGTSRVTGSPNHVADSPAAAESSIAWVFGSGRSGSTWLAEMLGMFDGVFIWHEPYFGKLLAHMSDHAEERLRPNSMYSGEYLESTLRDVGDVLRRQLAIRLGRHGARPTRTVIKEVNAPEVAEWVPQMFPGCAFIWLVRDPYDVLDSHLDMQRSDAWNAQFAASVDGVEGTAAHIARSFRLSRRGFDATEPTRRIRLRYEDLVSAPETELLRLARFLGIDANLDDIRKITARTAFGTHPNTGRSKFRRYGRVGVWRDSPNFTSACRRIADRVLGGLREELGYRCDVPDTAAARGQDG
ncbi:MAG: sulfotransferase [Planctomycetes bacterium]|nr:sulfotransferase [Planctomycetota bacterium]